jgi:hypothetical protein
MLPEGLAASVHRRPEDRSPGVHLEVPAGRLRFHVLAAPKSGGLWDQVTREILTAQLDRPVRTFVEQGRWGVELVLLADGELSRFVGLDGPRWLLYGVATGRAERQQELADSLRALLADAVVVRGLDPHPVKSGLPLTSPTAEQAPNPEPSDARTAPWRNAVASLRPPRAATGSAGPAATGNARPAPAPAPAADVPPAGSTAVSPASADPPTSPDLRTAGAPGAPARRQRSIGRDLFRAPTRPAGRAADEDDPPTQPIAIARPPARQPGTPPAREPARPPAWAPAPDATARPLAPHPPPRATGNGDPREAALREARERLTELEARMDTFARYREVLPVIAGAADRTEAADALARLLNIRPATALSILDEPWHSLTSDRRRALAAERERLLGCLSAPPWPAGANTTG